MGGSEDMKKSFIYFVLCLLAEIIGLILIMDDGQYLSALILMIGFVLLLISCAIEENEKLRDGRILNEYN